MLNSISQKEKVLYFISFDNTAKELAQKRFINNNTQISYLQNLLINLLQRSTTGFESNAFELDLILVQKQNRR
jgi:hypothetical protein